MIKRAQDIPRGFSELTIYWNGVEAVLCEQPGCEISTEDETHNCDALGCSSVSHVFARGTDVGKLFRMVKL